MTIFPCHLQRLISLFFDGNGRARRSHSIIHIHTENDSTASSGSSSITSDRLL